MTARGILLETPGSWSEPMHWSLREGERKLLTVGSNADWSIASDSLLPVHATLYFDGAKLCVAAAPGALLNGEPLGRDWSPLSLPAQLSLGDTHISLAPSGRESADDAPSVSDDLAGKTSVMGFPDLNEFRQVSRIAGRIERGERLGLAAFEADRVTPTGMFMSPFIDPEATQMVLPSPSMRAQAPNATNAANAANAANAPHASSAQRPVRSAFMSSFHSASWPKRLTVLLLPVVIALSVIRATRQHQDATRAPAAPSASAARPAPSTAASLGSATSVAPALGSAEKANAESTTGLTLQRRAVDAFATGNFGEAALLYQRLATESPADPAFAVAARLAKERANGGNHD